MAVCMNPDLRPPKVRESLIKYFKSKGFDQTSSFLHELMNFEEEEEMKDSEIDSIFAEPKLNEYIFVIDRSGSMFGQPM